MPPDQGPAAAPKMPRAATTAWSRSPVNHSPTRSAAAIGIQRSSLNASVRPSLRKLAAGLQQFPDLLTPRLIERRRRLLEQRAGEMRRAARARRRNPDSAPASSSECARIASMDRVTSFESTSGRPSGESATRRGSGRRNSTRRASCMSATIDGRSGPVECASVGQRYAGRDLLGHRRSANHRTGFEDERLVARAREVEGRDQTVVAGADD